VPLHLEVCGLLERSDRDAAIELLTRHFAETEELLIATDAGAPTG
jgi:DNA-binding GntR family transcriptional regulator